MRGIVGEVRGTRERGDTGKYGWRKEKGENIIYSRSLFGLVEDKFKNK